MSDGIKIDYYFPPPFQLRVSGSSPAPERLHDNIIVPGLMEPAVSLKPYRKDMLGSNMRVPVNIRTRIVTGSEAYKQRYSSKVVITASTQPPKRTVEFSRMYGRPSGG